jgi:hypothetical protein
VEKEGIIMTFCSPGVNAWAREKVGLSFLRSTLVIWAISNPLLDIKRLPTNAVPEVIGSMFIRNPIKKTGQTCPNALPIRRKHRSLPRIASESNNPNPIDLPVTATRTM